MFNIHHMTGQNINLSCESPQKEILEHEEDLKWLISTVFMHHPLVFMTNIREGELFCITRERIIFIDSTRSFLVDTGRYSVIKHKKY